MPDLGTKNINPHSFRLCNSPLYKRYLAVGNNDIDRDRFFKCINTSTEVIAHFIEHEPEGVKLPYIGLLMAYRIKMTEELKKRYIERQKKFIPFKAFSGRIAWFRFKVGRFKNYKLYEFLPERELLRRVKKNANKSHPYFASDSVETLMDYGIMLLKLDDTVTKKLKQLIKCRK
jgi:hypothetical protein